MSNILNVYKLDGSIKETISVDESFYSLEPNQHVMHEVLTAELAAARQGGASTKTRAEVSGGGKKPFSQKGTGRARQGSSRAPHMPGGGVVFGPKPRSYEKKVNKKVRKLALKSALATKLQAGNVLVLDEYELETPKTKTVVNFEKVTGINTEKRIYIVSDLIEDKDYNFFLSMRNIANVVLLLPQEISVYWLLKADKVVVTKEALKRLEEVLV